jgi:Reverse transcriptase (RNA-dependent DNA polymerase).
MVALNGPTMRVAVSSPQRGVLLPLLWCLIVDDLIARLNRGGIYTQGYTDDICLLVVGKFPDMSGNMQWARHTIETRYNEVRLLINPDKTGLVVFTRKRKLPGFFESHLFGIALRRSMLNRNLGVILEYWLTWREHVIVGVKKTQNLLWVSRRTCGIMWGPRPKLVH